MSSRKGLLQLEDEDWRRIRTTITPTFSAVKLKQVGAANHLRLAKDQTNIRCWP